VIIDWLITPILALVNVVLGVLPTDSTFSSYTSSFNASGFETAVTPYLQQAAFFLPVHELALFAYIQLAFILPAMLIYELAQWGYRELPTIMGFGPS
jgi:hypothetical protein